MGRRKACRWHSLIVALAVGIGAARPCLAGSAPNVPRAYCGISCLYTIMKLAGRQAEYGELLQTQYIGSQKGSSLAELRKAAVEHSLHATILKNLTSAALRTCSVPLILHVRATPSSKSQDHFILFLGAKDGRAILFDPERSTEYMPFHQLAPLWDGTALAVSPTAISLMPLRVPTLVRVGTFSLISLGTVLLIRWARSRWVPRVSVRWWRKDTVSTFCQFGGLVEVAGGFGICYHYVNHAGMLAQPEAVANTIRAHRAQFIPHVGRNAVRKAIGNPRVFIVDARYKWDYLSGCIEGATSIPVDTSEAECRKQVTNIPTDARIVVYCQSRACGFAEKVAIRLLDGGFANVAIYRGGWRDWIAKDGGPKEGKS